MDWPGQIGATREIEIETRKAEDAPAHRTPIWIVVNGGDVFVRSVRGKEGRWYREISANPAAVIHVDGESVPVRATAAADPESVQRATAGYESKYSDSSALDSVLRDEILDTTLRLEPN
jgi:hypothetical protein